MTEGASLPSLDRFVPSPATLSTEAFSAFLSEYRANVDYFFFVTEVVSRVDSNRIVAAKALLPGAADAGERQRLQQTIDQPNAMLKTLQTHSSIMSRNLTNGIVSAFQRYFSAIVQAAALKQPALLMSAQQIQVDDILRFSRHRDLVSYIVDRKVNDLAYGGLIDLEKYFKDRLGIRMFEADRERQLLRLFIEARNINVHNGGVVNELFLSRAGVVDGFVYKRGQRFHVDFDSLVTLTDNAMKVAMHIDTAVAAKFRIRRKASNKWGHRAIVKAPPAILPN
jgi:hypothetical protein